jgi:hypothetical protein
MALNNKAVTNFINSPPERNLIYKLYDCQKVRVQFRENKNKKSTHNQCSTVTPSRESQIQQSTNQNSFHISITQKNQEKLLGLPIRNENERRKEFWNCAEIVFK